MLPPEENELPFPELLRLLSKLLLFFHQPLVEATELALVKYACAAYAETAHTPRARVVCLRFFFVPEQTSALSVFRCGVRAHTPDRHN